MNTYKSEFIIFPKEEEKIIDIIEYGENELLVLTWAGNIWKYNMHSMQKKCVYKYEEDNDYPYSHIVRIKNILYLIPKNGEEIEELERGKRNKIIYPIDWKLEYIDVSINEVFVGCFADEKQFSLYPCKGNMLLKMNAGQKCFTGIKIYEDSKGREKAIAEFLETNGVSEIVRESSADLELFLNGFTGRTIEKDKNISDTDGMRIWRRMGEFEKI